MYLKKEDENKLLVYKKTCLRKILGVGRLDKFRNTDHHQKITGLEGKLQLPQKRLHFKYYDQIMRMNTERMPYITLNGTV